MKVAFFFDTYLLENNNNYYAMTLNADFFKRKYLTIFDNIIVSTRVKRMDNEKGNYNGYKIVNDKNIEVVPIKSYNIMYDVILKNKSIKKEIEDVIDRVDKVIIRMPSIIGIIAFDICKKQNKKYIIELVACPLDGYMNHTNFFGKIIAPFIYLKTKKVIKVADNVLYVTNYFLQNRYPTNGNSYSCSDVELTNKSTNVLQYRLERIKSNKAFISLLTIGNVGMKYKGQKYVIKALKKLSDKGKNNYKYYLIGNGDYRKLEKVAKKYKVSDRVIYLGSVNHDSIFRKLLDIDIYIQPSLQEGLPRALIEAMSMGCPAIGSNAGGIPELLNEEYIFKKKNVKELVKIIEKFDMKKQIIVSSVNYTKSLEYKKEKLDEIREKIYNSI